jgi:hypothetical protein
MEDPPIAKLHRDLLWQIFTINTTLDLPKIGQEFCTCSPYPSPLTTARHTSQVCASWRQLIIDSPLLWGNIIDLQALRQKSDAWRNEVLLRTGHSDLSIFGDIRIGGIGRRRAKEFLEMLLKNHWTRIKWVHIRLDAFNTAYQWPDSSWSALGRPAPSLRFFSIRFGEDLPSICSSPGFILFANHAPLLAHFQQNEVPMNFQIALWTSNLISLTLNSTANWKLRDLLETCSRMRSLQTLHLMFEFGTSGPSPTGLLHYVNMPSLSTLIIECPFDVSLAFLDHIEPASGCSLQLSADLTDIDSITPTELIAAQRILAKFANNYFCYRSATSFRLSYIPAFEGVSAGDMGGFTVTIRYAAAGVPTSLFLILFGTFKPAHISGVKTLFLITYARPLPPPSTDFLAAMTALEELQLTSSSLIYFISLLDGNDQRCSFPHLKTLIWESNYKFGCYDMTSLIVNFLATRRKIGMPIEIFDFTDWYMISDVPMDAKMLEKITGLKVVWREEGNRLREYICGSGRPQELDVLSNST